MSAWKIHNDELIKIKVTQTDGKWDNGSYSVANSEKATIKAHWVGVLVVVSRPFQADVLQNAFMNLANHKVYIKSWNVVINPTAPNGGYCGKHITK